MKANGSMRLLQGRRSSSAGEADIREAAAAWVARRDGCLGDDERAELEAWLAADPRHRAAFSEYGSAWAVLDRPGRGGRGDDLLEELQTLARRRRRCRVVSCAAAVSVLLAGVSFWTLPRTQPDGAGLMIPATAKVLLPERQTLADGTVVELKPGARIVADLGASHRRVTLLKGDAYFRVAKDPERPFVVEGDDVEVRAVGTAFAVTLGTEAIEVIVTEGRVAIEKAVAAAAVGATVVQEARRGATALLGAGEHAKIGRGFNEIEVRAIADDEVSERMAWRAPRMEFGGTPLSEVLALLNQQASGPTAVRFSIADPAISQVRVSGLFRVDNTAVFLDLLESGFGITAERRDGVEIILRRSAAIRE